jgi:hypothetical protein
MCIFKNKLIKSIAFCLVSETMADTTAPPPEPAPPLPAQTESTRFVMYEDGQLDAFTAAQQNPGTVRKTLAHVNIFKDFLGLKSETRAVHLIPPEELDVYLGAFFAGVRKSDGDEYEPSYLKNIQNSIERHLKNRGYTTSLTNGIQFHHSREILKAKQIHLRKQGKGNNPHAADAVTPEEVDKLWETGQLGCGNPESLLQTLWWVNTTQFGIRAGAKEHLQLCWGDIKLKQTIDGVEYIERDTERQTKTRTGLAAILCPNLY